MGNCMSHDVDKLTTESKRQQALEATRVQDVDEPAADSNKQQAATQQEQGEKQQTDSGEKTADASEGGQADGADRVEPKRSDCSGGADSQDETKLESSLDDGADKDNSEPEGGQGGERGPDNKHGDNDNKTRTQKLVRLFVSSTFDDMGAERDALQASVFPRFRQRCAEVGWEFQVVDLRWGIRDEATDEHRTVQICREEIKRCRDASPRFNFLLLLGDRYGYRPLPDRLVSDEYTALLSLLEAAPAKLLREWYSLETNSIPAMHMLHNLTDATRKVFWNDVRPVLGPALQAAARQGHAEGKICDETLAFINLSVTEQEVHLGMLSDPLAPSDTACYARSIQGWQPAGPQCHRFRDVQWKDGEVLVDEEAAELREALRQRVHEFVQPENYWAHDAQWQEDGTGISQDHVEPLCAQVEAFLHRRLEAAQADMVDCEHTVELQAHHDFAAQRARAFVGREKELARILAHAHDKRGGALVVRASSGAGKSSLLAAACHELLAPAEGKDEAPVTIVRFCGHTRAATSVAPLIESLVAQLDSLAGLDSGEANKTSNAIERFAQALERARKTVAPRPIVFFFDALDQLSDYDTERVRALLSWLPVPLPQGVAVVCSVLDNSILEDKQDKLSDALDIIKQFTVAESDGDAPNDSILTLGPMSVDELPLIVDSVLKHHARTLQPEQRAAILAAANENPIPMYVQMLSETACRWPAKMTPPPLPKTLREVCVGALEHLERFHGKQLLACALGALGCAEGGLTEPELIDALTAEPQLMEDVLQYHQPNPRKFPPIVWLRLREDLGAAVAECAAEDLGGGKGGVASTLKLFHRQLREAAEARYMQGPEQRAARGTALMTSTLQRIDPTDDRNFKGLLPDLSDTKATTLALGGAARQFQNLLTSMRDAKAWEKLDAWLTDLDVLNCFSRSGLGFRYISNTLHSTLVLAQHSPAEDGQPTGAFRLPRICAFVLLCHGPSGNFNYVMPWEPLEDNKMNTTRPRGTHCLHFDRATHQWKCFDKPFRDLSGATVVRNPMKFQRLNVRHQVTQKPFGQSQVPAKSFGQPNAALAFGADETPHLPAIVRLLRRFRAVQSAHMLVPRTPHLFAFL